MYVYKLFIFFIKTVKKFYYFLYYFIITFYNIFINNYKKYVLKTVN